MTWHDGAPFTAEDVKFSVFKVWKVLHPRNQTTFANVTEVETPDPHTAILKLSQPAPAILAAINANGAQILPKHLYDVVVNLAVDLLYSVLDPRIEVR